MQNMFDSPSRNPNISRENWFNYFSKMHAEEAGGEAPYPSQRNTHSSKLGLNRPFSKDFKASSKTLIIKQIGTIQSLKR